MLNESHPDDTGSSQLLACCLDLVALHIVAFSAGCLQYFYWKVNWLHGLSLIVSIEHPLHSRELLGGHVGLQMGSFARKPSCFSLGACCTCSTNDCTCNKCSSESKPSRLPLDIVDVGRVSPATSKSARLSTCSNVWCNTLLGMARF
jgi:hypothetical protein